MSKEQVAAGEKEQDKGDEDEEFVMVETDNAGKPLNGATDDKDEDADKDEQDDEDDKDEDDDDDGHEDQRAGHIEGEQDEDSTQAGETPEERKERRRRENRTKRVRNRVAAQAKERLLQNQAELIHTLNDRVARLEGHSVARDATMLQDKLGQIEAQQADAKRTLEALGKAGDFAGVAEVTEIQMQLRDQHRNVSIALQRAKQASKKAPAGDDGTDDTGETGERRGQPKRPAPIPEAVKTRATAWADKHKWLNPETNPEESEIVRAIDRNLAREGWDPRGDDYWDELTSRVKRRLPHRFTKKPPTNGGGRRESVDNNDKGDKAAAGGPRMAQSSQTSGGRRPLKPGEVYINPERKKAMQEAGAWDDPAKRKRMLASYAKYDREHAADRQ